MARHEIAERTDAWHAMRAKYIGGSEIAGLYGVQPDYGLSAFTLWSVKSGLIPAPPVDQSPGSRVRMGILLEPIIGAEAALIRGWAIRKGGYWTDDTTPGMGASVDFEIAEPSFLDEREIGASGPAPLQIKNVDALEFERSWIGREPGTHEPPYHIILQNQHEIACMGATWGAIAALVGGNRIEIWVYPASQKLIADSRRRVTEFWQGVHDRTPPRVDGSQSTADALAAMYPVEVDQFPVDLTGAPEIEEICTGWMMSKADLEGAKASHKEWDNQLRAAMAGHVRGVCVGYAINGVYVPETPERKASLFYRVKERIAA